jgi:focal adhesion kinase 1
LSAQHIKQKPKILRKAIQAGFKKYGQLSDRECSFKFLEILKSVYRFDQERFRCALGSGWSIPVELVIGSDVGIAYTTDSAITATHMADFSHIQSIQTVLAPPQKGTCDAPNQSAKASLQLRVAGSSELLTITCPSLDVAESMADLIDGYCRLVNRATTSIWHRKDGQPPKFNLKNHIATNDSSSVQSQSAAESKSPSPPVRKSSTVLSEPNIVKNPEVVSNMNENMSPKHTDQTRVLYCEDYAEIVENEEGDYSSPARDYEIDRSRVELHEIIGEGQFGDVHKGVYNVPSHQISQSNLNNPDAAKGHLPIAVKTCKVEGRESMAEKFLEEAYIMQQFDHQHIIKLVGICSADSGPVWIVMELARYGELRAYLLENNSRLSLSTLVLFSYQLCTALSYLESKKFVHRDIAARYTLN